jgi:hypothetical protein
VFFEACHWDENMYLDNHSQSQKQCSPSLHHW